MTEEKTIGKPCYRVAVRPRENGKGMVRADLATLEPFVLSRGGTLTQPAANGDDSGPVGGSCTLGHAKPEKNMAHDRLLGRRLQFSYRFTCVNGVTRVVFFKSHNPLFPGYVFLRGDESGRVQALETNLVASCIPVSDQPRLHADLARVYRLMQTDAAMIPEAHLLPGAADPDHLRPARGLARHCYPPRRAASHLRGGPDPPARRFG